jgi:hypothetical protein
MRRAAILCPGFPSLSGENVAVWDFLVRGRGLERYVVNKKPLISFTQLGCSDARGEQ